MPMTFKQYFLESNEPAGMDTYWQHGDAKVTIKDVMRHLDAIKAPVKQVSMVKLKPIIIDQDYAGAAKERVHRANLQYPIIVVVSKGEYKSILDGNHRAFKALANDVDAMQVRELHLDAKDTPQMYRDLFDYSIEALQENFVPGIYGDADKKYSINKLVQIVSKRSPVDVSIDKIIDKNKTLETAEGNFLHNIKKPNKAFYDRAMRANTQYPVMLSEEGWIVDGSHRVSKLKWAGHKNIKVHVITKDDLRQARIFSLQQIKHSERIRPMRLKGAGMMGMAGLAAALGDELPPDAVNRMTRGGLGIKGKFEAMP
jgi:hypothetical protein